MADDALKDPMRALGGDTYRPARLAPHEANLVDDPSRFTRVEPSEHSSGGDNVAVGGSTAVAQLGVEGPSFKQTSQLAHLLPGGETTEPPSPTEATKHLLEFEKDREEHAP